LIFTISEDTFKQYLIYELIEEALMPVNQFAIIGIHGLAQKPAKPTLTKWWKAAICEGLNHNIQKYRKKAIKPTDLNFSMVYWNELMGEGRILEVKQLRENNDHYQPAVAGDIQWHRSRTLEKTRIKWRELLGDITEAIMRLSEGQVSREVMRIKLQDLSRYYKDQVLMDRLHGLLKGILIRHENERILLISHSMGTIIAYDVLIQLAEEAENQSLMIEHFITMGSPLGLPFITERIQQEGKPPVPGNVNRWTNFADMSDPVCADPYLADDYEKSGRNVEVVDQLVLNDWPHDGLSHKSYGYLRTPEVSKAIAKFIG